MASGAQRSGGEGGDGGEGCNAVQFARLAQVLAAAAHDAGVTPPTFRSPAPGGDRRLRRHRDGTTTVLVTIRRRPVEQVALDMVDGVLSAVHRRDDVVLRARLVAAVGAEIEGDRGAGGGTGASVA